MVKKKAFTIPVNERQKWIDKKDDQLTIAEQLDLIGIPKSTYYYKPVEVSEEDLAIMKAIDQLYTGHPYYGSRRMKIELKKLGRSIGRKKVSSLMEKMGLIAQYPKPNLSKPNKAHKKYPYLLKDLKIVKINQVWSVDITYIPMNKGFLYLVAIIDWYSRKILSWRLSNTLDNRFCIEALKEALKENGCPEFFNMDQGVQFTSEMFLEVLEKLGIKISMDGKGRALDNILIERFWRSLKYEDIYIKRYETGEEAFIGICSYINFYNNERPHQALQYQTPNAVHAA